MLKKYDLDRAFVVLAVLAWISSPAYSFLMPAADEAPYVHQACPSGRYTARLTGWRLNEKMPVGTAVFDARSQELKVVVEAVALPDGTELEVRADDDRIGEINGLKSSEAEAVIRRQIKDGTTILVFNGDRPIVSGNLACDNSTPAQTPTAAPTMMPSPTPTASPVVPTPTPADPAPVPTEPLPTPMPEPTASPTAVPPATPTITPTPPLGR